MKEKFARWEMLLQLSLRRDWKKVTLWILGIGLFSGGFVPAFEEMAKGEGKSGLFETLQNPAMISIVGPTPAETVTDYTLGAMYAQEMLLFCGLFTLIISILHVIGHTRREEDLGLTELVRSFQVGRQANSLATMIEVLLINGVLALLTAGVLMSFGADSITFEGSLLFGASVGMAGVIGGSIALFIAQIMPTSSGATGASLGMIGLLYIIRAGTDLSHVNLSMLNPLGWTYLTYPFTNNDWLPILWGVIFVLIIVAFAIMLEGARDMGAGYLPEREGRARAKKSLLSVGGLLLKLNKGIIISWLLAFLLMGIAYGSIYGDMQTFLEGNDFMKQMFSHAGISIEESFTATIMNVMISLIGILPIVIINKLFTEESRLHLSQIFATKVSRGQLYWTTIGIAIMTALMGILFGAGGLGGSALAVMTEEMSIGMLDFLMAGYNFLPAILFLIGIAALILGWLPTFGRFVYIYLAYSFFLTYFNGLIDFPDWVLKTAVQSWLPQMPIDGFEAPVFITITVLSIVLMVIGAVGYHRRDLYEGA